MLFKILHGDKSRILTDITPYHEGYCYVTHDGGFYVDMNGERIKLNAKEAEKITGYDILQLVNNSEVEIPTSHAVFVELAKKQNKLTFDTAPTEGSVNSVKSGAIYQHVKDNAMYFDNVTAQLPYSVQWQSITYGAGKFVAVAYNSDRAAYSTDGITWEASNLPVSASWNCVRYLNDRFIAIASNNRSYAYSTDGVTWEKGSLYSSDTWNSVAYGNGTYVVVASQSYNYSTDGENWSNGGVLPSQLGSSNKQIIYGGDKFVVITKNKSYVAYSTTGTSWQTAKLKSSQSWDSITYSNGMFVMCAQNSHVMAYSTDGITWTESTMPTSVNWTAVTGSGSKFVALAMYSDVAAYSVDGINWIQTNITSSGNWIEVAYGGGVFVAISNSDKTTAYSYDGVTWSNGYQMITQGGADITSDTFNVLGITPAAIGAVTKEDMNAAIAEAKEYIDEQKFVITCDLGPATEYPFRELTNFNPSIDTVFEWLYANPPSTIKSMILRVNNTNEFIDLYANSFNSSNEIYFGACIKDTDYTAVISLNNGTYIGIHELVTFHGAVTNQVSSGDERLPTSIAVYNAIESHNVADTAHQDIRNALDAKVTKSYVDEQLDTKSDSTHKHDDIYDTKGAADTALASAKAYADSAATQVKNDLLNGAGGAYDTLKELGDLIDDNVDAIEALETIASGKANAEHSHEIADVNGLQTTLNEKAKTTDLDPVAFDGYVTKGAAAGSTIGTKATVEGSNNIASSKQSHAEGGYTRAGNLTIYSEFSGSYDSYGYEHAEGYSTLAKGNSAHAEGGYTQAISSMSHAEGVSTIASGTGAHAEGKETTASGYNSHAEGYNTTASGENTHAEGNGTTASLQAAHAEGYNTTASGYASHAEGYNTKASSSYQHVQGKNNVEDTASVYAYIVGNGASSSARSNAHTLDWKGNAWFAGDIRIGGTCYDDAISLLPKRTSITLSATSWSGSANLWSQVVAVNGVTANSKVDLQPTAVQIVEMQNKNIALMAENNDGVITVYAIGDKPTVNYTMQALITEVILV